MHPKRKQKLKTSQEHNDCGVRAVAAACNVSYDKAYKAMSKAGRRPKGLSYPDQIFSAIEALGKETLELVDLGGVTVRQLPKHLTRGNYLVAVRRHFLAIVDGEVIDWSAGRLFRTQWIVRII